MLSITNKLYIPKFESGFLLFVSFVITTIVLGWIFFSHLSQAPEFIHFDYVREGIFANNVRDGRHYAYSYFNTLGMFNSYVVSFATVRLFFSVCVSLLVGALAIQPLGMELFLRVLAGIVTLSGCAITGWLASRGSSRRSEVLLFVAAISAAHPLVLLIARNGAVFNQLAFAVFWIFVALLGLYLETGRRSYLYGLVLVATFAALNLYAFFLALPVVAFLMILAMRRLARVILDGHVYMAVIVFGLAVVGVNYLLAEEFTGGKDIYVERLQRFYGERSTSFSKKKFELPSATVLTKFVNQHVLFKVDKLGDRRYGDEGITLDVRQSLWLCLVPLMLVGIGEGLLKRSLVDRVFGSVLVGVLVFAFFIAYPEGRYTVVVVPALVYFAYRGLQATGGALVSVIFALREKLTGVIAARKEVVAEQVCSLVIGLLVPCFCLQSGSLLFGPYLERSKVLFPENAGIRELARQLPLPLADHDNYIAFHRKIPYHASELFRLLTGGRFAIVNESDILAMIAGQAQPERNPDKPLPADIVQYSNEKKMPAYFVLIYAADSSHEQALIAKGFRLAKTFAISADGQPQGDSVQLDCLYRVQ